MKLTLIATSNGTRIVFNSFPALVGREILKERIGETIPAISSNLQHVSKKHIEISYSNSRFYLADPGSLNGTCINNTRILKTKRALAPGDLVSLAQRVDFIVDFTPAPIIKAEQEFILEPEQNGSEVIGIDRFPIYFEGTRPIGHQGASGVNAFVLHYTNSNIHIAPLTTDHTIAVNGNSIPLGATIVSPNDRITVSPGKAFVLRRLREHTDKKADTIISGQDPAHTADAPEERTIYMAEATTFMNIFEEDKTQGNKAVETNQASSPATPVTKAASNIVFKGMIALIALLTICFGSWYLYRTSDNYRVHQLFSQQKYDESLIIADAVLAEKKNKKVEETGKKALILAISGPFTQALRTGNHQKIPDILENYRNLTTHINDSEAMLNTFSFIARVNRFPGKSKSYRIDDELWKKEIRGINNAWNQNKTEYKTFIAQFVHTAPALTAASELFFSKINDCREMEIYYLNKILEIEKKVTLLLQNKNFTEAASLLKTFSETNLDLTHTDVWQKDLERYIALTKDIADSDLFTIDTLQIAVLPQSPLFKKLINDYVRKTIPSALVMEQISRARNLWNKGQVNEAATILEQLPETGMQKQVKQKVSYLKKVASYQSQLAEDPSLKNCMAAADLFRLLNGTETALIDRYRNFYNVCFRQAQKMVPHHTQIAINSYARFKQSGGINGQMRMEMAVTDRFKNQASLLAKAEAERSFVNKIVAKFSIPLQESTQITFSEIATEHHTQTARITESAVLSASQIQAKLIQLEPDEVDGWQD